MDNPKVRLKKISIKKALSLGLIILGMGFISWALIGIWTTYHNSEEAQNRHYAFPTAFAAELIRIKGEATKSVESLMSLYPEYPKQGDSIGNLTIPVLDKTLPIIEGTGEQELKDGAGHFSGTALPGEDDNCIISAHRDTYFRGLGRIVVGDLLIAETSAGVFTYSVTGMRIVDADDRTVIVPTDHAVLTLTTCYPFDFIGSAPDRYIVSADLVTNK